MGIWYYIDRKNSSISTIRCQRKGMTDSKMGFYKYSAISIESVLNLTSQVCDSRLTATLLSPMTIAKKEYQLLYSLQLQKYIKLLALTIRITVWLISTNSARLWELSGTWAKRTPTTRKSCVATGSRMFHWLLRRYDIIRARLHKT